MLHAIFTFSLFFWTLSSVQAQTPAIAYPTLDLQGWNGTQKEINAEVWVMPGMQTPEEFRKQRPAFPVEKAPINTQFSQQTLTSRKTNSFDTLSYAILLKQIPEGDYGIRLRVDTAADLYVIADADPAFPIQHALNLGRVGPDANTTIPEVGDRLGRFRIPAQGNYWLLINIANYHYPEGQVWRKPIIGTYSAMQRSWLLEIMQEVFVFGLISILTAYNLALYFNRREDKSNLWLAGYCLFSLLRFIGTSAVNLPIVFPVSSVGLHRSMRLLELAFSPLASACFVNFVICNFNDWGVWRMRARIFGIGAVVYLVAALCMSTHLLPNLILPLDFFALAGGAVSISLVIKAMRLQLTGAKTMLIGCIIYAATVIYDILAGLSIIQSPVYLSNYGLSTFIFFQGQVVAKLFARAFRTAKLLSTHLEEEVDKKTRDIRSMLDNIPLGICSVSPDGLILPNFSSQLPDVIGVKNPEGLDCVQTVFGHSDLTVDAKDLLIQTLKASFNEDVLGFETNSGHLPTEIKINYSQKQHHLQCIWSPITDKNNCVARIMLVLRDITSLKQAEAQRLEHQLELEYIIELVNVSSEKFQAFVASSLQFLSENDRLIRQNTKKDSEIVKIIFVNMHTIKGAARTLGFYKMTSLLHEVEQVYSSLLKEHHAPWQQQKLLDEMSEVKKVFDYYVKLNSEKLGRTTVNTTEVSISRETLEEQNRALRSIQVSRLDPTDAAKIMDTIHQIEDLCFSEASDVFLEILSSVQRVARDLGKEIPIINVEAKGFKLKQSAHELLSNAFVHIIRNSLDHGIETGAERVAQGKRPTGRIDVKLYRQGEHLAIQYRDDGRGLNMQRLRERALRDKLLSPEELKDLNKLANLIFVPGLSTAQSVTEISGRGIGMDAVKRYLETEGGKIHLLVDQELNNFAGFSINLLLPSSHFLSSQDDHLKAG